MSSRFPLLDMMFDGSPSGGQWLAKAVLARTGAVKLKQVALVAHPAGGFLVQELTQAATRRKSLPDPQVGGSLINHPLNAALYRRQIGMEFHKGQGGTEAPPHR